MVELVCPQCTATFQANPGAVVSCPACDFHGGRVAGSAPVATYQAAQGEFSHREETRVLAPGGDDKKPETSRSAITGFVLGICFFVPIGGIFAIMFGIIGLSQIRESKERKDKAALKGKGLAITGIALGGLFQLVWFMFIIMALAGLANGLDQIFGR